MRLILLFICSCFLLIPTGDLLSESTLPIVQPSFVCSTRNLVEYFPSVASEVFTNFFTLEQPSPLYGVLSRVRMATSSKSITSSQNYTPHAPIEISSDEELAAVAVSGNGTKTSPYILEGWNITTNGLHGIYIHDTTTHFIIQNCWINMQSGWDEIGILINHVAPRTVTILNNTCQNNDIGIFVRNSAYSMIVNNSCDQNSLWGIYVFDSEHSMITFNTCNQNGLVGIVIGYSEYVTVENNTCYQNLSSGIDIHESIDSIVSNNTCIQNKQYGISLSYSANTTISNNNCTQNDGDGIWSQASVNAMIVNNLCQNNSHGISLVSSESYSIILNILIENKDFGIYLDSTSGTNQIQYNTLLNNNNGSTQSHDSGSNNVFEYNFWD
ncbi:MAG: nitrous oxide reductase family maturation protein NosD, partial [Promethearchaeota archaeon]